MEKLKLYRKYWHYFAAFLLGFAAFICIYGFEPLRVTGIGWTLHGYDNNDITQHQTGWMYFRYSPWSFPICKALNLGYPEGTSIAFTDSIPLAALIFKLLSPILPEKFQYFGIYTCFCFMMQGLFAAALLYHFNKNRIFALIGSVIFVFSSCFLERCFRHTALSSHWLLLAGLLLYFVRKKNSNIFLYTTLWTTLLCTAIAIHPYLFAMVYGLFVVSEWKVWSRRNFWKNTIIELLFCTGIVFLWGYILGIFGTNIKSAPGFGMYNLNLNAFFNAESKYHNVWSAFTQNRPLYSSQGDGIYYLGAPMLVLFSLTTTIIFISKRSLLKKIFCEYYSLLILLIAFTLFAISNVITFDNKVLFVIPIPDSVLDIANIFRSSERFFFVPYYCIILYSLSMFFRLLSIKKKLTIYIVFLLAILQIVDIYPGLKDLHYFFEKRKIGIRFSENWKFISDNYQSAVSFEPITDRNLSFWLAQNKFRTNIIISSDIHKESYLPRTEPERKQLKDGLETGLFTPEEDTIYIISDYPAPKSSFSSKEDLQLYLDKLQHNYTDSAKLLYLDYTYNNEHNGYWILAPDK